MLQQISSFYFLLLFFSFFLYSCDGNVLLSADASENITFDANTRLFTARVNLDSVIKTIDDRFLSLTLDTSIIRHDWAHFDTRFCFVFLFHIFISFFLFLFVITCQAEIKLSLLTPVYFIKNRRNLKRKNNNHCMFILLLLFFFF